MRGRLIGIKKTYLLRTSAILAILFFIASTTLSIIYFKIADLWFYCFCLSISIFELTKGLLFKLDSSIYLGLVNLFIGISGYTSWLSETIDYTIFYISASFILASLFTFGITKQKYHLIFSFSLFFVTIYGVLLKKNFINTPIFIAFIGAFLLLLIVEITIFFARRK